MQFFVWSLRFGSEGGCDLRRSGFVSVRFRDVILCVVEYSEEEGWWVSFSQVGSRVGLCGFFVVRSGWCIFRCIVCFLFLWFQAGRWAAVLFF